MKEKRTMHHFDGTGKIVESDDVMGELHVLAIFNRFKF